MDLFSLLAIFFRPSNTSDSDLRLNDHDSRQMVTRKRPRLLPGVRKPDRSFRRSIELGLRAKRAKRRTGY